MELVLIVLGVSFVLELFLFSSFVWRRYYAQTSTCFVAIGGISFATTMLLLTTVNVASVCVSLISVYRIVNLLRVVEGRMNLNYMYNTVLRTYISLVLIQAAVLLMWLGIRYFVVSEELWLGILCVVQLAAGVVLLTSTIRRLRHTKLTHKDIALTSNELPNVTVAIPARNETDDLYECLTSLVKNNYPKLEILVLDDCSQLRRTPEIIREFAHAGVRFVKGDVPRENWLAKNQAYDKLLREASGEIVLFCGVDVRFKPDTVHQIVLAMLARKKRMICILPLRLQTHQLGYAIVQAGRYFWELAPPRRLFNRPAILSTCWGIYRRDILKLGGFAAVSRAVVPEAYFAKQMLKKDGYSFLRADANLLLYSVKSYKAQRSTAIRTRYPQLHRRPETVVMITLVGLACFMTPYALVVLGLFGFIPGYIALLALASIILCNGAYTLIATTTKVAPWHIAAVSFLPVVCTDIALMHYSLYKYEFSEVLWKGRNVCVPVMHVIPHLPKA